MIPRHRLDRGRSIRRMNASNGSVADPGPGSGPGPAHDGLAKPVSFEARYGAGSRRGLVLGGGGVFFVAWQVAYLNGLAKRGVQLDRADIIVGTSAGSLVASIMGSGGLRRFGVQVDLIARIPALVGLLAPASHFTPSQLRALNLFREAGDANPDTVRAIGHAALAAHTPSAAEMRRNTSFTVATRGWTSPALHITATDVFTAERLVIDQHAGISSIRAAAASSAVPGIFSPQPILDRFAMDGGTSGSGTHCDVVAGADKALVVALGASIEQEIATMTIQVGSFESELAGLRDAGTEARSKGPLEVDLKKLMDPTAVPEALALGDRQAAADAGEIAAFWNL